MSQENVKSAEKKKQYAQKFRQEWLSYDAFKEWLKPLEEDPQKAYCTICKRKIKAKYQDLIRHGKSKVHINTSILMGVVPSFTDVVASEDTDWDHVFVDENPVPNDTRRSSSSMSHQLQSIKKEMEKIRKSVAQFDVDDRYSMYGRHIINELRDIKNQQILKNAMHKINLVIYESQLEQFNMVEQQCENKQQMMENSLG